MIDALYDANDEANFIAETVSELLPMTQIGFPHNFQWGDLPPAIDDPDEQNRIMGDRERAAAGQPNGLAWLIGRRDRLYYYVRAWRRAIDRGHDLLGIIASFVNRPGDAPIDFWTAGLRDELSEMGGVIHRFSAPALPAPSQQIVTDLRAAQKKIAARIERLRSIGPEAIRPLAVHEALVLLDGREAPLDKLAAEFDLDLLQVLDRDGLIEVRYRTWNKSGDKPFQETSVWFSPLKYPGMAGPWKQIFAMERNAESIPCDVRLSGLGEAQLAQWRRQKAGGVIVEAKPAPKPAPAGPKRTVDEVRTLLLEMKQRGEPYTSTQRLGDLWGCAKSTVAQAIRRSTELKAWAKSGDEAGGRPAASITPQMESEMLAPGDNPSEAMTKDEVDAVMAKLIDQAQPKERAELNELNDEGRRRMAETVRSQMRDVEPSPTEPDPPADRPRKVKAHKRA